MDSESRLVVAHAVGERKQYMADKVVGGKAHNIVYTKRLNTSCTPQVHVRSITSCTLFLFITSLRIFLHFNRPYIHSS